MNLLWRQQETYQGCSKKDRQGLAFCIDAQIELESMVVMFISIQFGRSGGNPKKI